jgi:hypothetical protein
VFIFVYFRYTECEPTRGVTVSIWSDVRFDHAAAGAAIAACRATAAICERAAEGAARASADASLDWDGEARHGFERVTAAHLEHLERTAARCRELADDIEVAAEAARYEQRRRLTARAAERAARARARDAAIGDTPSGADRRVPVGAVADR